MLSTANFKWIWVCEGDFCVWLITKTPALLWSGRKTVASLKQHNASLHQYHYRQITDRLRFDWQVLRDRQHQARRDRRIQTKGCYTQSRRQNRRLQTPKPHHVCLGDTRPTTGRESVWQRQRSQRQFNQQVTTHSSRELYRQLYSRLVKKMFLNLLFVYLYGVMSKTQRSTSTISSHWSRS